MTDVTRVQRPRRPCVIVGAHPNSSAAPSSAAHPPEPPTAPQRPSGLEHLERAVAHIDAAAASAQAAREALWDVVGSTAARSPEFDRVSKLLSLTMDQADRLRDLARDARAELRRARS